MGIHSGEAELHEGDYFGQTLNLTARLMSIGHGGQVLLSQTATNLARNHLPAKADLLDMGLHQLRDIAQQENVFQLVHPGLQRDFPTLKSLDKPVGNLPIQVTSFIGREDEIQEVCRLFDETRLLTLTGIGGVGKTRLALQLGSICIQSCPDGAWLVELAPVVDPGLLRQEIASSLGVSEGALNDFLRDKSLLIILDNCEHLLEASAQVTHDLLNICPQLRTLATSREALGVQGEVIHRVRSLTVPDIKEEDSDALLEYDAVRLFTERAVAVEPKFTLTGENATSVAQIARRLDGIPLAIELAASRVKGLPVQQIAVRLDDRFRLLTGGSRTALPRQRTLQATIDWSYQMLSEAEALLLNKLSVFRGGFTIEAAEHVGAEEDDPSNVLELLLQLVDKSLVVAAPPGPGGTARYYILETLRQYGGERLAESGIVEETRRRHTSYFANWIHELQPLLWGENPGAALDSVETDHDNMRAALEWSIASGSAETALKLVGDLPYFWMAHRHVNEGNDWAERAISAGGDTPPEARAPAFLSASLGAVQQLDYERTSKRAEESLKLYRELGDGSGIARAAFLRAMSPWFPGDMQRAGLLLEEAEALNQQNEDPWSLLWHRHQHNAVKASSGDYEEARASLEQSLASFVEQDNPTRGWTLLALGSLERDEGDYIKAATHYEESLPLFTELGDYPCLAASLAGLGTVAWLQGDRERALSLHQESIDQFKQVGERGAMSWAIANLRFGMRSLGDLDWALDLFDERRNMPLEEGVKSAISEHLYSLGRLVSLHGDLIRATAILRDSLTLYYEIGHKRGVALSLLGLAIVARAQGEFPRAARLLGSAESLAITGNQALTKYEKLAFEEARAATQAGLGADPYAASLRLRRGMPIDEAVSHAFDT